MKEAYYTKETILSQGKVFKNEIIKFHKNKSWKLEPEKTALLILDMQGFFLDKNSHAYVPSAKSIIPKIKDLSSSLLNSGSNIIFTKHINTIENSQNMRTWWRDILTKSNKLSEINKDVLIENSPIIIKSQYDAFYNTDLEKTLLNKGISQIIISGVMTHLCCETTARSAFIRGFDVFFGIDLTATYNRNFHLSSLINLSHGFATPVLCDDIISNLKMHSHN